MTSFIRVNGVSISDKHFLKWIFTLIIGHSPYMDSIMTLNAMKAREVYNLCTGNDVTYKMA